MKVFVIVDMQEDFIRGSLGSPAAEAIVPNIVKVLEDASKEEKIAVFTTLDTHGKDYLQTQEGRNLPVEHCIVGTPGHQLDPSIKDALTSLDLMYLDDYNKSTFGCVDIAECIYEECEGHDIKITEFVLMGLCTDICVISNAVLLKTYFEEVPMSVLKDCCAGVTPEKHEAALEVMRSLQIKVV